MTQPVQEPSQGRTDQAQEFRTRQLFRRPSAVTPGVSGYLQPSVHSVYGLEWQVLTSKGNWTGGNTATDPTGGSWVPTDDSAAPFGGYISTTVDKDYFQFAMPNLGPQGSSYAVAVWYYGNTDAPQLEIEWATGPIDEAGNTTGPIGSDTSIVGPWDVAVWSATDFSWYNTNNAGDASHSWKWDSYATGGGIGWDVVVERSPFVIMGVDGTPLTANGSASTTFEWNREFNGGGGPGIAWWVRVLVNGKNASSSGYHAKIAGIRVYRFNGSSNALT